MPAVELAVINAAFEASDETAYARRDPAERAQVCFVIHLCVTLPTCSADSS